MAWSTPRTYVAGELVTAAMLNSAVRDQFRAIGQWSPGDLKMSYVTHANATTTTLTEPQEGWFIANGAAYSSATYPLLHAAIGSPNPAVLPDYRGRVFVPPGTQGVTTFSRDDEGGEDEHTLTASEIPAHTHPFTAYQSGSVVQGDAGNANMEARQVNTAANTGGDNPHNNLQPYLVGGMVLIHRDW